MTRRGACGGGTDLFTRISVRPLRGQLSRQWVFRRVSVIVLTVIAVLIAGALAPFALREQRSSGSVADTAALLTGQVQAASDGCAVSVTAAPTLARPEVS